MSVDPIEQRARELLALGLDEYGHHSEAANVREGVDLDSYKADLWSIAAAIRAKQPSAQEADSYELPPLPKPTEFLIRKGSDVTARAWNVDQMRAYAKSAVAAMSNPQHPSDVVAALRRFIETTDDDGTTDLPRHELNALVAFGYLAKPSRSYWEITALGRKVAEGTSTTQRPLTDEDVEMACKTNMHAFAEPSATEMKHMRAALEAVLPNGVPVVSK